MTIDPGNMQGQPTDPPHDVTRPRWFWRDQRAAGD